MPSALMTKRPYHGLCFLGAKESELKANTEGASALGQKIAEKAKAAGIESVVFDRSGHAAIIWLRQILCRSSP